MSASVSQDSAERYHKLWQLVYIQLAMASTRARSPHDLEDLTQDVFLHLLRKDALERLESKATDEAHFQAMVLVSAKRLHIDHIRKACAAKRGGRNQLVSLDVPNFSPPPCVSRGPAEEAEHRELTALVKAAQSALRREYEGRKNAAAFYDTMEDYLLDPITSGDGARLAAKVNMSEGHFRVSVYRARRRFRNLLRAAYEKAA